MTAESVAIEGRPSGVCIAAIEDDGGYEAPSDERDANAEFIVRACNAHDDLVAALEAIADQDLTYLNGMVTEGKISMSSIFNARAALAKARS